MKIEGDNLEVLKLLQKSYAGKVKLIYIDPPYNTGKDFVYPDDYRDNIQNYLKLTGQIDSENLKLSSNTESSGRFHTDWLSMMYARLKLARNILREDSAIFISIDDLNSFRVRLSMPSHDARLNLYIQTESDTPDFVNGLLQARARGRSRHRRHRCGTDLSSR